MRLSSTLAFLALSDPRVARNSSTLRRAMVRPYLPIMTSATSSVHFVKSDHLPKFRSRTVSSTRSAFIQPLDTKLLHLVTAVQHGEGTASAPPTRIVCAPGHLCTNPIIAAGVRVARRISHTTGERLARSDARCRLARESWGRKERMRDLSGLIESDNLLRSGRRIEVLMNARCPHADIEDIPMTST